MPAEPETLPANPKRPFIKQSKKFTTNTWSTMEFYHQTRAIILLLRILYAYVCTLRVYKYSVPIRTAQYDRCFAIMYIYKHVLCFSDILATLSRL